MTQRLRRIRLLGVALLLIGVLAFAWGMHLNIAAAEACQNVSDYQPAPNDADRQEPNATDNQQQGGCGSPGLRYVFGGIASGVIGLLIAVSSQLMLMRKDSNPA